MEDGWQYASSFDALWDSTTSLSPHSKAAAVRRKRWFRVQVMLAEAPPVEFSAILLKKGRQLGIWRERHFELYRHSLSWYEPGAALPRQTISVTEIDKIVVDMAQAD